jgi:hypothetical protein
VTYRRFLRLGCGPHVRVAEALAVAVHLLEVVGHSGVVVSSAGGAGATASVVMTAMCAESV